MKIYIMTDLEGVAGVLDFDNWCEPSSRYYETAKELLTGEVNAAIDGFFSAGATEITVADGHGKGGINPHKLDRRAGLMRNWTQPAYPFGLDKSYAAAAWVGQHAKAGTALAHLPHTGWFDILYLSINGRPAGEFGEMAFCAGELGVPVIFGAGDQAFCEEARALVPGMETVAVKKGTTPGSGDDLDMAAYRQKNLGAIHFHPQRARTAIRAGAEKALRRFRKKPFGLIDSTPPYELVEIRRAAKHHPQTAARVVHPTSVIALLNLPREFKPI